MALLYCPLESYSDRYTGQLAAPMTGWNEGNWQKAGVNYRRIDRLTPFVDPPKPVGGSGPVLDTERRFRYTAAQTAQLIQEVEGGLIANDDVVFLDDFWHPGIEQFFLACDLKKVFPRVYAQLWAQSIDRYDFTYGSRDWIRHVERGYARRLAGIFVACPSLAHLVRSEYRLPPAESPDNRVHAVGLPFRSADVTADVDLDATDESAPEYLSRKKSEGKRVVWSSRLDTEKNPYMLHEVAYTVLTQYDPEVEFVVCTGQPTLRGDQGQIKLILGLQKRFPQNITIRTSLTKQEYYHILHTARVQFNAANQDWISFTLLEASAAGCYPVYPNYRSFPETFLHQQEYLYEHLDFEAAAAHITQVINSDALFTPGAIRRRAWIHERFDSTWDRQLNAMGITMRGGQYPDDAPCDPFDIEEVRRGWPEAGL